MSASRERFWSSLKAELREHACAQNKTEFPSDKSASSRAGTVRSNLKALATPKDSNKQFKMKDSSSQETDFDEKCCPTKSISRIIPATSWSQG
jgi:hypothetical protein